MRQFAYIILLFSLSSSLFGNINLDTIVIKRITGKVVDFKSNAPLPYANIYLIKKQTGVISNEQGNFSIDATNLDEEDSIRFQYLGYKTKVITNATKDTFLMVRLEEEIFNLNEAVVFGSMPNVKAIVKNIIKNKDKNYPPQSFVDEAFIRARNNSDLEKAGLSCKKSSINEIDKDLIELIEEKIPKQSTSYTDFLGKLYFNKNIDDSIKFKIDPTRVVSLKEKDIAEFENLEDIFMKIIKETKSDEYWKFKTGIISKKIDIDPDDTVKTQKDTSINKNSRSKVKNYTRQIEYYRNYSTLNNEDQWEFLYKTGKYDYEIIGGTRVGGEDVYIIDFKPRYGGVYIGRMYVSILTNALIKADYQYAPEKNGRDFHMFGIGYTENKFDGSIFFEKADSTYVLSYFSYKIGTNVQFDRSISFLKKRKRFLFDKKMNEIKIGIDFSVTNETLIEYLSLKRRNISQTEFNEYDQDEYMDIILVEQFDDNLWQGYSIIEPTRRMKEYKKQNFDF